MYFSIARKYGKKNTNILACTHMGAQIVSLSAGLIGINNIHFFGCYRSVDMVMVGSCLYIVIWFLFM